MAEFDEPAESDWFEKVLWNGVALHATARCPTCGEPVYPLTNGMYVCKGDPAYSGAHHTWSSRRQLDGGVRWWHGRLPFVVWITLLVAYWGAVGIVERIRRRVAAA